MSSKAFGFIVVIVLGLGGVLSFRLPPLQFISGFLSQAVNPIEALASNPARQTSGFFATIQQIGELRADNDRLREEVARLRADTARYAEVTRENEQLRDQLNLKREQTSYQWLTAHVVGRDGSNLLRSVAIDKGSADGLIMGMTVITPAGLVGQINRLGPHTARVLLVSDVGSSVTAVIQGARAEGVVSGRNSTTLLMSYIPQQATIKTADRVVTSGVGGIFPSGIPIGHVISVGKKDTEPFQEAQIEPEVDFQRLEIVLVITNHVPLRLE